MRHVRVYSLDLEMNSFAFSSNENRNRHLRNIKTLLAVWGLPVPGVSGVEHHWVPRVSMSLEELEQRGCCGAAFPGRGLLALGSDRKSVV